MTYRVTHVVGENLQLTQFRQFWQLLGRYCSYLLPRQDDGTSKTQVNWRFLPTTWVTLYNANIPSRHHIKEISKLYLQ